MLINQDFSPSSSSASKGNIIDHLRSTIRAETAAKNHHLFDHTNLHSPRLSSSSSPRVTYEVPKTSSTTTSSSSLPVELATLSRDPYDAEDCDGDGDSVAASEGDEGDEMHNNNSNVSSSSSDKHDGRGSNSSGAKSSEDFNVIRYGLIHIYTHTYLCTYTLYVYTCTSLYLYYVYHNMYILLVFSHIHLIIYHIHIQEGAQSYTRETNPRS